MKRFATRTVLAAVMAGACTTTHWVKRPASAAELESWMPKQRDRVTLLREPSSAPPPESRLDFTPVDRRGAPEAGPPLTDVSRLRGYEVKHRGQGALEGLAVGILVGAVVGMAIGVASGDDRPCTNDDGGCVMFSGSFLGVAFAAIGALVGSAVGPVIGFAVGHTHRYEFSNGTAAAQE